MIAISKPGRKTLAGVVGVAAATILYVVVPAHEGEVLQGYLDPVGVATKCYGDTTDVVVGREYSREECLQSLEAQLIAHAEPVLACTPSLQGHPHQLAAAVSLAYNIGAKAYCRSTVAKRFNEGKWPEACAAFSMWNKAGGRVLKGLVRRRANERNLCEQGLLATEGGE